MIITRLELAQLKYMTVQSSVHNNDRAKFPTRENGNCVCLKGTMVTRLGDAYGKEQGQNPS